MYPLYALPSLLSSCFTLDSRFYDCYIRVAYILLYHLCSILPVFCSYLIMPWVFPAWYQLLYIYLLLHACAHNTIFNSCSWFGFIDTCVLIYARHLAFASPLAGEFCLTPLDPHVQVMELGACGFSQLLIRVAQLKRGSPADRSEPHPSRPPYLALEFFCYDSEPPFVLFILVYLLVFSHLHLSVM